MDKKENQSKERYQKLRLQVEAILFKHDPMGLDLEGNTDEYSPEAGTILPRLKEAKCKEDVANIVYEEFVRWFDEDNVRDKNDPVYMAAATEIWETHRLASLEN